MTAFLSALIAGLLLWPSAAKAWWNDEWEIRKKVTIDTSATGANITDPIGGAVVLVRLHLGNFRFAAAKERGEDIRFVAGDDKTPLKYHIEKFDPLLGEGLLWVSVPDVKPGAKADVWLYYGNKKAVPAEAAKATYDPDTLLVYHFAEKGTAPQDSSIWANNAQGVGQPAKGAIIGQGLKLDGTKGLALPGSPSLGFPAAGPLTWSAWVKLGALQPNAALYTRRDNGSAFVVGVDNGAPFVEVNNAGAVQRTALGAPLTANSWHYYAVVAGNGKLTLYVDAKPYATLNTTLPKLNASALVGADTPVAAPAEPAAPADKPADETAGESGEAPADAAAAPAPAPTAMAPLVGEVDELHISKVERPLGVIKLAAVGEGPDAGKLISYSVDEQTASWLSGYFGIILKSVTLDGWVVIGLLGILFVISTFVMVDKISFLGKQAKANTRFLAGFRELAADLTIIANGTPEDISSLGGRLSVKSARVRKRSSLYRVYQMGASETRQRVMRPGGGSKRLQAPAIAAIRAAVDSVVVKELQRLNRAMVVLTIAISGGPFLGLLGTVVGVMITFAAIAASGDVNVNAIAPGIAAALVATVAGLAVAIPALFGYNYLISRIKDITSDIHVFVDEFVTRVAEVYAVELPPVNDQPVASEQHKEAA